MDEIFYTCLDWLRIRPIFLYNGYSISFPRVKRPAIDIIPHLFLAPSFRTSRSLYLHLQSLPASLFIVNTFFISVWIRKTIYMSLFVFFISLLTVAQHVSGNHVPIIRSWRLRDVIASCWYVPWLQEGCQDRLAGSASMDGFVLWWWAHGCPKHVEQLLEEK